MPSLTVVPSAMKAFHMGTILNVLKRPTSYTVLDHRDHVNMVETANCSLNCFLLLGYLASQLDIL